jgi:hypothetical protein
MVRLIPKIRKWPDHYNFSSPVIGLHVCTDSHKLQDESITKLIYKPHPCQKEIATHTDQNAVTKSMKHDCYLNIKAPTTNSGYSGGTSKTTATSQEQKSAADAPVLQGPQMQTMKKMVNAFKYASTVFAKPDKLTLEPNHTTHQSFYTPVPLEFLKEKRTSLIHKDIHAHSDRGVRLSDPNVQSEYKKRFMAPVEDPDSEVVWKRDMTGVRGCAKLNLTHNTITGMVRLKLSKLGFSSTRVYRSKHWVIQ